MIMMIIIIIVIMIIIIIMSMMMIIRIIQTAWGGPEWGARQQPAAATELSGPSDASGQGHGRHS